jgi:RHS repeat-associated protein
MKPTSFVALLVAVGALAFLPRHASAYYHAQLGRFLQRDRKPGGMTPPLRVGSAGAATAAESLLDEYPGGVNLYQYVQGNPVRYLDPKGTDIYLKTGNDTGNPLNDAIHQKVCVDTHKLVGGTAECPEWQRTGMMCFSFGWIKQFRWFGLYRTTWLGWQTNGYTTGTGFKPVGEIYIDRNVGRVVRAKATLPLEDINWLHYMLGHRRGLQDLFVVTSLNCRTYSQWEFEDAPGNIYYDAYKGEEEPFEADLVDF